MRRGLAPAAAAALLVLAAGACAGWVGLRAAGRYAEGVLLDAQSGAFSGYAELQRGRRYDVELAGNPGEPVTCRFEPRGSGRAWSARFPDPGDRGLAVTRIGTITAPATGTYEVPCSLGGDERARVRPAGSWTDARLLVLAGGLWAAAVPALAVAVRPRGEGPVTRRSGPGRAWRRPRR